MSWHGDCGRQGPGARGRTLPPRGATTRCNAPWVGFSPDGKLYLAATLTGEPPSHAGGGALRDAAAPRAHPMGTVGFIASPDGGRSWEATVSVIPSNALNRFETDGSISTASMQVPWEGARGAVDAATRAVYLSGAYPALPGGADHSQRFYSLSTDGGMNFGAIRAFGSTDWPERWDGDIAAAGGEFIASYLADSTPQPTVRCPCAVVAVSHDGGKTSTHHLIAGAEALDVDTLVHYPEVAADPWRRHRFAMVLIAAQKDAVNVYVTADDGASWTKAGVALPGAVIAVTRPAVAFSPGGALVAAWRGMHVGEPPAPGSRRTWCGAIFTPRWRRRGLTCTLPGQMHAMAVRCGSCMPGYRYASCSSRQRS